ncbi:unnamed protein product, partial [Phaeothamnion confervicola]
TGADTAKAARDTRAPRRQRQSPNAGGRAKVGRSREEKPHPKAFGHAQDERLGRQPTRRLLLRVDPLRAAGGRHIVAGPGHGRGAAVHTSGGDAHPAMGWPAVRRQQRRWQRHRRRWWRWQRPTGMRAAGPQEAAVAAAVRRRGRGTGKVTQRTWSRQLTRLRPPSIVQSACAGEALSIVVHSHPGVM